VGRVRLLAGLSGGFWLRIEQSRPEETAYSKSKAIGKAFLKREEIYVNERGKEIEGKNQLITLVTGSTVEKEGSKASVLRETGAVRTETWQGARLQNQAKDMEGIQDLEI